MRTIKLSSFGGSDQKELLLQHDWTEDGKDISVQGGGSGVVFSDKGGYTTAFFEAFPNRPSCFIRGEGPTIEEAENAAWDRYTTILACDHEMERRNRTDGYGYCKHCTYSATVFEPLTKCCKCGVPTAYSKDFRGKYYCKKHSINKPKSPDPNHWENKMMLSSEKRLPRKLKKKYKEAFAFDLFYRNQLPAKNVRMKKGWFTLTSSGFRISQWSKQNIKKYVKAVLKTKNGYMRYVRKQQKTR
jgi:hypothetical protein